MRWFSQHAEFFQQGRQSLQDGGKEQGLAQRQGSSGSRPTLAGLWKYISNQLECSTDHWLGGTLMPQAEASDLEHIKRLLIVLLVKLGATSEEIGLALRTDSSTVRKLLPMKKIKPIQGR